MLILNKNSDGSRTVFFGERDSSYISQSDIGKIPGHHYFDKSKEPKSGLAVPKAKYCKVQQEKHRKEFMQQYNICSKDDS